MKSTKYDVIVLGVGGMGSATCYHLSKKGHKVLGLEQFKIGHDFGSSHGDTRMIRRAYYEHPDYVPLLDRAYELWLDLEKESGHKILTQNGLVTFAHPQKSEVYRGTLASAHKYNIPIEELSRPRCLLRFPYFIPPQNCQGIFEASAGFLQVEKAVATHVDLARKFGAVILEGEKILSFSSSDAGVQVTTDKNSYTADKLVITAGGWTSSLLEEIKLPLKIHRLIQYWFKAEKTYRLENGVPCFVFHLENNFYYGFPMLDGKSVKIASHFSRDEIQDPRDKHIEEIPPEKLSALRNFTKSSLPGVSDVVEKFATCIYTMTPDEHFIIDVHPKFPRVTFAAGFSGHGFKFSSVVGEIMAELTTMGKTKHPVEFLKLNRFQK